MQLQSINWSFLDPSYTAAYFTTKFIEKTPLIAKTYMLFQSIIIAGVLTYGNFIPSFLATLHPVGTVITMAAIITILHSILQGVFIQAFDYQRGKTFEALTVKQPPSIS